MTNNKRVVIGIATLSILTTLTACGSGGGDGGVAAPPPAPKAGGVAALIETDNAGDAYLPQIAIDTNGNALAVWHQHDGRRYNV